MFQSGFEGKRQVLTLEPLVAMFLKREMVACLEHHGPLDQLLDLSLGKADQQNHCEGTPELKDHE